MVALGPIANVQAAIALEGLAHFDEWTERTRLHARQMDRALRGLPGVRVPIVPPDRTHVYYQYCARVPDRDVLARVAHEHERAVRLAHVRGTIGMDSHVCTDSAEVRLGEDRCDRSC